MRTEWVTVRTVWGRNREVRWILFLRYSGSIWLSGGVFGVPVSVNRQYRGLCFSSGKQSAHGVKEGSCWLVRRAVSDKNFSGQERVRRSNIRLPRFLDRVYVESQYKGHPVHTLGDLLRFLQVGPDDRTKTLESRESCSLLSWFAAKFRKNRRLCFVGCPKEVALSSRICQQYCAHSIGKCSEMKGVHVVVVVRQYQCPGKRKRSKNWCGFQERPRRAPLLGIRWCSLGERLQQIPAGRRRTWGRCRYM